MSNNFLNLQFSTVDSLRTLSLSRTRTGGVWNKEEREREKKRRKKGGEPHLGVILATSHQMPIAVVAVSRSKDWIAETEKTFRWGNMLNI